MKENELRIGNLVGIQETALHADGCNHLEAIFEIEELKKDVAQFKGYHSGEYYKDLKGIELTEEILLKCGFRKENNVTPIYTLGLVSIYWNSEYYPNGRLYFNSWCIYKEKPKHLHQLQNLYFALTNEELTIKL